MAKLICIFLVSLLLSFSSTAFGENKVVVIPLNTGGLNDSQAKANQGVLSSCSANVFSGGKSGFCNFNAVPNGKIFVAEFISGNIRVTKGNSIYIYTKTKTSSWAYNHHSIYARYQAAYSGSENLYIVSQPFQVYIDGGNSLGIQLIKSDTSGVAFGEFWVSGYYVNKN